MRQKPHGPNLIIFGTGTHNHPKTTAKIPGYLYFLATCGCLRQHKHARACILTYLLTPWSRVLLEKLTGFQLVKKFPAIYGTRRFITAFTSVLHLSLS